MPGRWKKKPRRTGLGCGACEAPDAEAGLSAASCMLGTSAEVQQNLIDTTTLLQWIKL